MIDYLDLEELEKILVDIVAGAEKPDPGPDGYQEKEEDRKRELMKQSAFYAEEGETFDPKGKYLCGSCYYRQVMDWGDTPYCYIVEGKISLETGSCQFYKYGTPDSEWNPIPMKHKYTLEASNYGERPDVKGFGCFPRCEYGKVAEGQDNAGREIWCQQFGVHVRPKACCAFEDGKDLVQIEAGGPGSGCNPEVGKCGRPEGEHVDYMKTKMSEAKGTNPGGLYKGSDGIERYIKIYPDPKSARGEALANHVYHDLGIMVPQSRVFETKDGKTAIASDLIQGKTLADNGITKDVAQQIMNGFAADVLTANWDAVGLSHDNVLVSKTGTAYRIDQGGTFLKRAQGGDKPENLLHQITETDKFFDQNKNAAYLAVAKAAGIKSVDDVKNLEQQVKEITSLRQASGGWQKYVAMQSPDMPKDEQNKIAAMMEARTNLLQSKVYELDNKPASKAPETPVVKPEDDDKKESKWRQYNPSNIGGYFRPNTAIATIYQALVAKEGQWLSVAQIKKSLEGQSTANLDNRFQQVKYVGKRSGNWQVEISGDNVRIFLTKAGTKPTVQDVNEDKQKIAEDYAKKFASMKYGKYDVDSKQQYVSTLKEYFSKMGVPEKSASALISAIDDWAGSSNAAHAQIYRQVGMNFYGREPGGEHVGAYGTKLIGNKQTEEAAKKVEPAAMAMKAVSGAVHTALGTQYVYRNIKDDTAKKIVKDMVEAESQGKTSILVPFNSLSSWSTNPKMDYNAGQIKVRMRVDPDSIWASYKVTPNKFLTSEDEVIVGIHKPKETFSIKDISIDGHFMGADLYKKYHKDFSGMKAAKEEDEEESEPYDGNIPLFDNTGTEEDKKKEDDKK